MIIDTEEISLNLDRLTKQQIEKFYDSNIFLKFRNQYRYQSILNFMYLANLFADFAEEDRNLAKAKF
jgi:hypothetical protein